MNMELITSAASDALVNVVLAIIALAGAYGVYYIRLGAAKLKEQTAQIKDEAGRKVLEDALDDVVNLATVSVGAMEQTTAKALRDAVKNGKAGREGMALGQYVAGMGFSNVGLGVDHSMAHTLSAYYDTPHGKACAILLPAVMAYNAEYTGEKYKDIARAMGVECVDSMTPAEYRKAAVDAVRKLSEDVGIPSKLEALKEEDLPFLAESAYNDACRPGNPKDTSVEDLTALFRKLM